MKKRSLLKVLMPTILFGLMLTSCGQGPKGNKGDTGPQGEQGQQGEPGQDGSSILTGNGSPSDNLGKNGDSYIDLINWNYYVKENDTWVLKGNIKGSDGQNGQQGPQGEQGESGQNGVSVVSISKESSEGLVDKYKITYSDGTHSYFYVTNGEDGQSIQGEQGTPGSIWLVGNTTPDSSVGNDNDLYLNNSTYDVYLKSHGSWIVVGNIKGDDGSDGKSAYEIAVENGFTGTKEEWLSSLEGKGISNVELLDGELIIHYSDGTSVNLGRIVPLEDNSPFEFRLIGGTSYSVRATSYAFAYEDLTIPSTYNELPVTTIDPMGFYYLPNLKNITIPNSVISIGESAFKNCASLNNPVFEEGLTNIGASAFENCSNVTTINIPATVNFIGRYAFYGTNLTSATLNGSYKSKDPRATNPDDSTTTKYALSRFISYGKLVDSWEQGGSYGTSDYSYLPEKYADIFTKSATFNITVDGRSGSPRYFYYKLYATIYVTDLVKI